MPSLRAFASWPEVSSTARTRKGFSVQIAAQKVVSIDYTLKDDSGAVVDSSEGRKPLTYLHGAGAIVPGLEQALEGKAAGDSVEVSLTPEQGYGERDPRLIQNIPIRKLPDRKAEVGMTYQVKTPEGPRLLVVNAVRGDYATVDANHPLAGMNLHFQVRVAEVRDATAQELEHGHVHGPEGHDH
jgi:FKBP-type peptidyl-prolyl cis-trans isomerase SlyD